MEELADRVGELKAAKSDLDAYLERLKALFVANGRDEAGEGLGDRDPGKDERVRLTSSTAKPPGLA